MKKVNLLLIFFIGLHCTALAQHSSNQATPAYRIYDREGMPLSFGQFSERARAHEVVLFGEFHNDPIVHWLQRMLVEDAAYDSVRTALGLEMLELDDQVIWNEYAAGLLSYNRLKTEAKLWNNHEQDYHPIIETAIEHGMAIVATNVPRRYASMAVSHDYVWLDSVDAVGDDLLPPLPIEIPASDSGYAAMRQMGDMHGEMAEGMIRAQALKDHVMAYQIQEALKSSKRVIHLNGDFHSKNRDGIGSFLELLYPQIDFVVITVVYAEDRSLAFQQEWLNRGDFVVVLPANMIKTH